MSATRIDEVRARLLEGGLIEDSEALSLAEKAASAIPDSQTRQELAEQLCLSIEFHRWACEADNRPIDVCLDALSILSEIEDASIET